MIFTPTAVAGAWLIAPEKIEDERGFFARTWCAKEFAAHGLNSRLAQCSVSFNQKKGTLRGMHYQAAPHGEAKLVRCGRGAIYDVALDLRPESATFRKWAAFELSDQNRLMFYIPEGCAHGFLTLQDDAEVWYQISEFYQPGAGRGVRWNDPAFGISWPSLDMILSERDRCYPDWTT